MEEKTSSIELITYKLGELAESVRNGFTQLEQTLSSHDKRIRALETWQAVSDEREKDEKHLNWTSIIGWILALIGAVATLLVVFK